MSNPEKLSPLARHIIFVQVQIIRKSDLPEDQGAAGIVRDYGVFGSVDFFLEYEARFDTLVDSVKRAAWILHAIAVRHPFQNGNKRTAFVVADAILREEWGFPIGALQKEREVRGVKVIPSKLYLSRYRHHLHADGDDNRAEEGDPEDPA